MRLHHIAYVCDNVERKASYLCSLFGFSKMSEVIVDEEQGVRILFLNIGKGERLELLEPLDTNSPVQRHLEKGGGLYHLCFEVDNLDETIERLTKTGEAVVVKGSVPAPAIENKRVAFIVTSEKELIEFVEMNKK